MANVDVAVTALQYVKGRMPLDHSDNKGIRPELTDQSPDSQYARSQRRAELKNTVDKVRNHPRFPAAGDATAKNVIYYGAFAIAAGYGNCLEMSCATLWYLNEQGLFNYDMVYYPGSSGVGQGVRDHIFVTIGQRCDDQGDFPTDFTAWDADAAICDVWSDIACLARDYPERWRARMNNWEAMGMLIASRLPTHDMWINVVDKPKKSYLTPG